MPREKKSQRTAESSFNDADALERQIDDPCNKDDPKYLQRMARRVRDIALKKEKAHEHKESQRRRGHSKTNGKDNKSV